MEILVYIGVFSIIIVSISSFVLWAVHSNTKAKVMRETLENARRAMEIMTREIKEAKNVYGPTTIASQLSLETEKYLQTGEKTAYIDFYICGTQLCSRKDGRDPVALTSEKLEITNLTFSKIITGESPSVQINLRINYKNPNNRSEQQASVNLRSSASLRSY